MRVSKSNFDFSKKSLIVNTITRESFTIIPLRPIKEIPTNMDNIIPWDQTAKIIPTIPKGMAEITIIDLVIELKISEITIKTASIAVTPAIKRFLNIFLFSTGCPA